MREPPFLCDIHTARSASIFFAICLPIYDESGWLTNRADMVDKYFAKEEENKKRQSPAAEFQRQIKFDISAYPKLTYERNYAAWRREFKAIATAHSQGLQEILNITVDRTAMTPQELDLDDTKNQAMYPVFQRTLQAMATKVIVLQQEYTKCLSRDTWKKIVDYQPPLTVFSSSLSNQVELLLILSETRKFTID